MEWQSPSGCAYAPEALMPIFSYLAGADGFVERSEAQNVLKGYTMELEDDVTASAAAGASAAAFVSASASINGWFNQVDANGDGKLSFPEFGNWVCQEMKEYRAFFTKVFCNGPEK
eukprot:TRINITY_DN1578_c0_g1_i1.p1 TRINITY_DN1578_c0_g1~~TRINITY_DN1578_c0_g1_i1.p1  ORF type:complete len:116 (-),score=18.07 TRINITY_DN1578_c0_g1_i1:15-362(-)